MVPIGNPEIILIFLSYSSNLLKDSTSSSPKFHPSSSRSSTFIASLSKVSLMTSPSSLAITLFPKQPTWLHYLLTQFRSHHSSFGFLFPQRWRANSELPNLISIHLSETSGYKHVCLYKHQPILLLSLQSLFPPTTSSFNFSSFVALSSVGRVNCLLFCLPRHTLSIFIIAHIAQFVWFSHYWT